MLGVPVFFSVNVTLNSLVSQLSLTLLPSSGMLYHKQSGKRIPQRHPKTLKNSTILWMTFLLSLFWIRCAPSIFAMSYRNFYLFSIS